MNKVQKIYNKTVDRTYFSAGRDVLFCGFIFHFFGFLFFSLASVFCFDFFRPQHSEDEKNRNNFTSLIIM